MILHEITDDLVGEIHKIRFGPPVAYVYPPLEYARKGYEAYLDRYAFPPKEVVLLGMNPGPWGMAQTGVPFGEVDFVKNWLGIEVRIGKPRETHPKRPVEGFGCKRSEVSGKRLWGWAKDRFGTPGRFFKRFFVANYCPLLFIEKSGRNRTPDKLRRSEREPLQTACDQALLRTMKWMKPHLVVGVGRYAEGRARAALSGLDIRTGGVPHPSPANPRANRGWDRLMEEKLRALGIQIQGQ